MTDLVLQLAALAEAHCGEWIARCPRPWCTNAVALERDQETFECIGPMSCGQTAPITWPADPDAIEAILLLRPVPITRNWLPDETLEQLLAENAQHGCFPPEWSALEAGQSLVVADIADQRLVGGILYQQLEAAGKRREIGA